MRIFFLSQGDVGVVEEEQESQESEEHSRSNTESNTPTDRADTNDKDSDVEQVAGDAISRVSDQERNDEEDDMQQQNDVTTGHNSSDIDEDRGQEQDNGPQDLIRRINRNLLDLIGGQTEMKRSVAILQIRLDEEEEKRKAAERQITELQEGQKGMAEHIKQLDTKLDIIERKQRQWNIRLVGIPENQREDCLDIVYGVLGEIDCRASVEVAHRTGPRNRTQPRHIIFRVTPTFDTQRILRTQSRALKWKSYYFVDDLTKNDLKAKRSMRPAIDEARRNGQRWEFRDGKLFVEGRYVAPPQQERPENEDRRNQQQQEPQQEGGSCQWEQQRQQKQRERHQQERQRKQQQEQARQQQQREQQQRPARQHHH